MSEQHLSSIDRAIIGLDRVLRTLSNSTEAHSRTSPSKKVDNPQELTQQEQKHAAGLMRVNHAGEVCAQALYQGQALTAKLPHVRDDMNQAAEEELDHLAWCEERLSELNARPSIFNPLWYGLSLGMGAGAGFISDKVSLGFVAATEKQVCQHLESHMEKLPENDQKSRAIVSQMLEDEAKHEKAALNAGGVLFPSPLRRAMSAVSRVMTEASYKV